MMSSVFKSTDPQVYIEMVKYLSTSRVCVMKKDLNWFMGSVHKHEIFEFESTWNFENADEDENEKFYDWYDAEDAHSTWIQLGGLIRDDHAAKIQGMAFMMVVADRLLQLSTSPSAMEAINVAYNSYYSPWNTAGQECVHALRFLGCGKMLELMRQRFAAGQAAQMPAAQAHSAETGAVHAN